MIYWLYQTLVIFAQCEKRRIVLFLCAVPLHMIGPRPTSRTDNGQDYLFSLML